MKAKTLGWLIVLMFIILGIMIISIDSKAQQRPWREKPFIVTETEKDALDEYFARVYLDLRIADNDVCAYSDSNKSIAIDTADTAFRLGTAAYLLADSARDTGIVAYVLADSAQDTAVTAMDTALAALVALDMTLQNVTDNGAITTTNVTVAELHTTALYSHFNYDGPNSSASLYFYNGDSPTGASLGWSNSQQWFYSSHNFRVVGDLSVGGNDIDIGDGGGFSGFKFNTSDDRVEVWLNGNRVLVVDADSTISAP